MVYAMYSVFIRIQRFIDLGRKYANQAQSLYPSMRDDYDY